MGDQVSRSKKLRNIVAVAELVLLSLQRTDLKVAMCCAKCEEKAQEEIKELSGE